MTRRLQLLGVGVGLVLVIVSATILAAGFPLAVTGVAIAVVAALGSGLHTVNQVREWRGLPRNDLLYLWATITLSAVVLMGVIIAIRRL